MKVEDLEVLTCNVLDILKENEEARNDDMVLYVEYVRRQAKIAYGFDAFFTRLFTNVNFRKQNNIKSFCSVERTRRKLQAKFPGLKGTNAVKRDEEVEEYRAFALKK